MQREAGADSTPQRSHQLQLVTGYSLPVCGPIHTLLPALHRALQAANSLSQTCKFGFARRLPVVALQVASHSLQLAAEAGRIPDAVRMITETKANSIVLVNILKTPSSRITI
jgi:hypothetical protein